MTQDKVADARASLATANRILARHGVLDGYGHVSVRHPVERDRFMLARSMAPGQVTPADVMTFGLDGQPTEGDARSIYLERFIHSSIYRSHPAVGAVVHSHSPSVIPFGVVDVPLRAVYHMGCHLGDGTPVFEIRDRFGDGTNMLIENAEMGDALATALGDSAVVLMRGHGNVVVAASLRMAVFRAVYTELNAKIQTSAFSLGGGVVNYLTRQEAERATIVGEAVVNRTWDLWVDQLDGNPASDAV